MTYEPEGWSIRYLQRMTSGWTRAVVPYAELKPAAHSRANSRCCFWSSPTGTCVALNVNNVSNEVDQSRADEDHTR